MSFDFAKAAQARCVLISGDEGALRRQALDGMLAHLQMRPDDFDLETLDADSQPPAQWLGSAGMAPFLAERRVVVVRHALRQDPKPVSAASLLALPASALLILVADEESGADDRQQRLATAARQWTKLVADGGGVVLEAKVEKGKAKGLLRAELQNRGVSIGDSAAELLLEMTGGGLSRALEEADKLVLFAQGGQIREADVRAVVVPSREWNVFKMADAIFAGDVGGGLAQLRTLMGPSGKSDDAIYRVILPTLGKQIRLLWQARLCLDAGCDPTRPTEAVRAAMPERPNLGSESPYRVKSTMTTARRLSLDSLTGCLGILADTDARLKGGLPAFSVSETMERMVMELAVTVRP